MQQVRRSSAVTVMHLSTISASKHSWHIGWLIGINRMSSSLLFFQLHDILRTCMRHSHSQERQDFWLQHCLFVREINNRAELKLSTTEMNRSSAHTYYFKPGAVQEKAVTITGMLKIIQASCFVRQLFFSVPAGLIVSLEVKHDFAFALNNCKLVWKGETNTVW